jgi:hypothetical protein
MRDAPYVFHAEARAPTNRRWRRRELPAKFAALSLAKGMKNAVVFKG